MVALAGAGPVGLEPVADTDNLHDSLWHVYNVIVLALGIIVIAVYVIRLRCLIARVYN